MRCLTLADELRSRGATVSFVGRDLPGAATEAIVDRGFRCHEIPAAAVDESADAAATLAAVRGNDKAGNFDWVVVDHYGLGAAWEGRMRPVARRILAVDDLADRSHDCELLLDQNFYAAMSTRYAGLVPSTTPCLLGPRFVLLRPEFANARRALRQRDGKVRRILVFFGGTDPTHQTLKVLTGLEPLAAAADVVVDAVVGSANPQRELVRAFCEQRPWAHFHCQVSNMAELIARADLGVGAGGATMWERCALGLPSLTVVFADNQVRTTEDVAKTGAIRYIGRGSDLSPAAYADAVRVALGQPAELASMAAVAMRLVDPLEGGSRLVAQAMFDFDAAASAVRR